MGVAEVQELREQQRAIGDVLRAVARSEGLQPVADEIVEAAKRLCHGDHAQLYLVDGDLFRILSQSVPHAGYEYDREHPHARDRSTLGRVGLTSETVQIPDVLVDPDYSFGAQQLVG